MFERFKSAGTLERELRDWTFEGFMQVMPREEAARWRSNADKADLEHLVRKAVAACVVFVDHAQFMQKCGTPPRAYEFQYHDRGRKLVLALAEKKGWIVKWDGVPNEFNVRIEKKS